MGTVHRLQTASATPSLDRAVAAYCASLADPGTRRLYAGTWRALVDALAETNPVKSTTPVDVLDDEAVAEQLAEAFTKRWSDRANATWNRNLDAVRGAICYWRDQAWLAGDPTRRLRRRTRTEDRTLALPRAAIDQLLERRDLDLREKTLWRMLYETAARSAEVLALNIEGIDLRNRCAKVRRKGGAMDLIVWQTGTARLLPRLLRGRSRGPLFVTERRARVPLASADVDEHGRARLSYRRADELFADATNDLPGGPWNLHQLRHSALTHAAESGANTATLLAYSGHTSVTSLARYARVSADALGRWQHDRDLDRRR